MKTQDSFEKEVGTLHIGRDEMNLAEFALGLASDRNLKQEKTVERRQTQFLSDGTRIDQTWTITGSDKFGLPRASDDDILLGLLKIASDQGFRDRQVNFSRYELLKVLELDLNGRNYERFESALERLAGVRIIAKNSFWDNSCKSYVSLNFGIIDDYCLVEKRGRLSSQLELPLTHVTFNEKFFSSMQSGNVKRIDLTLYNSLKSYISKRLYRYLDKRRYRRRVFDVNVYALASATLGLDLTTRSHFSQIRQVIDKSNEELKSKGFLGTWLYRHSQEKDTWFIQYNFNGVSLPERSGEDAIPAVASLEPVSSEPSPLEDALVQRGISAKIAQKLVKTHPERVQSKIEMYDALLLSSSPQLPKNPLGWLRKAIEDDYQDPKLHIQKGLENRKQTIQAEISKEEEQINAQERARGDMTWSKYLALSPEQQQSLMGRVRSQYSFIAKKESFFSTDNPIVKSAIISLLGSE